MIAPSEEYLALAATLLDELSDQQTSTIPLPLSEVDSQLMNRYRDHTAPAPSSIRSDVDLSSTARR